MKRILLALAAVLSLCALLSLSAGAADGYLVQISQARLPLVRAMDVELTPACDGVWLVSDARDLAVLRSAGAVIYAEPNEALELDAAWNLEAIHAAAAWEHTDAVGDYDRRGSGVTVAVVDSGIQADHADLNSANILPYKDYGNNENGVDIWHGTFVAGIIAAQLDNGTGVDGVAPDVTLLPVTVTSGGTSDTFTAIRGIEYAANNGADVINLSIGSQQDSLFLQRTCRSAAQKGVILVAAAGNYKSGETPGEKNVVYPAGYDYVVSVSGCKQTVDGPVFADEYSYFNSAIDVCAPGSKIRSLYLEGSTAMASGTSFAAPTVSAMAAVAKQANPAIDTGIFLSLLEATCTDLGDPGRDVYYGRGLVDMDAFVAKLDEQYPIRYISDIDPETVEGELRTSYCIADGDIPLPVLSRSGWRFLGWYEDPQFTGKPVEVLPTASMGERSYYAKWEQLPNTAPVALPTAPVSGEAAPASLDAVTPAIAYSADVSAWFTDPDGDALTYEIIAGPGGLDGSLDGSRLTCIPSPEDAETERTVTVRAADSFGHSAEHTVTVRVGPLPPSQPALAQAPPEVLYDPPTTLSLTLSLYGSRVTGVSLDGSALDWRMEAEILHIEIPASAEGAHSLTVEFDTGAPITLPLQVRTEPYIRVRDDAPTEGSASPPSLDGISSATPYSADVSAWFSSTQEQALQYEKTAGPGTLTGSYYLFNPTAADADTDAPFTVRASDGLGHSAEHTVTIHVSPLPLSQPTLEDPDDSIALDLCRAPDRVAVDLRLYGAQVTAVRLDETALDWRVRGETLYVTVPPLGPGNYDVIIECDAGVPIVWPWHVFYSVPGPAVLADAPAQAEAAPASADGSVPAVTFAADVSAWFTGTELQYTLVSGPGSLDGASFRFTPSADDAGSDWPVTLRAEDAYGRSAMHTVLLRVGPVPAGLPVPDALTLTDCALPAEISAAPAPHGAELTAVRLDGQPLDWRLEEGCVVVAAPGLAPGDYDVTLEYDAGASVLWHWHVARCPSARYRDIDRGPWYHEPVDWVTAQGLMNGMAADRFEPQGGVTRAMLVTVLYRAAGSPEAPERSPFADVAANRYYSDAVAWAAEAGVVNGMAPDRFAPDAPITREQLVTILFRYAGDDGSRTDLSAFPDADAVSPYAREAMAWAVERGIVNGVGGSDSATLSPRAGASRAQVAAILMRYLTADPGEVPQ